MNLLVCSVLTLSLSLFRSSQAVPMAKPKAEDTHAINKSLMESIPTDQSEVFAQSLDWAVIAEHSIVALQMRPWVSKKIAEYLGDDEPPLVDFICSKLSSRVPAIGLVEELRPVLDDEAEPFVLRLWRMLIFCSLKAKTGQA